MKTTLRSLMIIVLTTTIAVSTTVAGEVQFPGVINPPPPGEPRVAATTTRPEFNRLEILALDVLTFVLALR